MKIILVILAAVVSTTVISAEPPSHVALMDTAKQLHVSSKKLAEVVQLVGNRPSARNAYQAAVNYIDSQAQEFRIAALQSIILKNSPQIDLRDYRFGNQNANQESSDELSTTITASYLKTIRIIDYLEDLKQLSEDRDISTRVELVKRELESASSRWGQFVRGELERFSAK